MEKILINWLKMRFLNCSILTPQSLEEKLNYYANRMCNFKVHDDFVVDMYDESNFVKSFKFTIVNSYIRDISSMPNQG